MLAILLTFWTDVPVWLSGDAYQLNATSSAFIGLSILLVTGVLAWQDVLAEKSPWNTRVWFVSNYATLGMVAGRFIMSVANLIVWVIVGAGTQLRSAKTSRDHPACSRNLRR